MAILMEYFNKIGLKAMLKEALPDGRTSPNATDLTDICISFLASVHCGADKVAPYPATGPKGPWVLVWTSKGFHPPRPLPGTSTPSPRARWR